LLIGHDTTATTNDRPSMVCSNIMPRTPQRVHLVVSSGGKYNHILAT